jgi:hypothetical protein
VEGVEEFLRRGDPELLVQLQGLLRSQGGDAQHRPNARRDLLPQLLHGPDVAGTEVLQDLLGDGLAHVVDQAQAPLVHPLDVPVVAAHRAGGLLVGPGLERIAARDRDQVGVLLEELLDLVVRPGHRSSGYAVSSNQRRSAF